MAGGRGCGACAWLGGGFVMRRLVVLAVMVAVAGGCAAPAGTAPSARASKIASPASSTPTASPSSSSAMGSPSPVVTPSLAADEAPLHEDDPSPVPVPAAQWDEVSLARATQVAGEALVAFARPDATEDAWWEGLSPWLSVGAREAFAYTDPAMVPVRSVTGPGAVTERVGGSLVWVEFSTDAGVYEVLVSRNGTGQVLVERISPVGQR